MSGNTRNRESIRLGVADVVKHVYYVLAVVKHEVLEQVVGILEALSVWTAEMAVVVLTEALVCSAHIVLEIISLAHVGEFQVATYCREVVKYDFIIAILVAVVFCSVLPEIGRKFGVFRVFAHNGAKVRKNLSYNV